MKKRIGILGAPSVGKSTLARSVASSIAVQTNLRVEYIDEFATEFIGKFKPYLKTGFPSIEDQYLICQKQIKKENDRSGEFIITDSPMFLSFIYGFRVYDPSNLREVQYLSEIYQICVENMNRYDYLFLLPVGKLKPQKKDERLHTDNDVLIDIEQQIIGYLNMHKLSFNTIQSIEHEKRIQEILSYLGPIPQSTDQH